MDSFTCGMCQAEFKTEIDLETHLLFVEGKFMAPCSTNLAMEQHHEAEDLRKEYRNLSKIIDGRVTYIRHLFADAELAKPYYSKTATPPLDRWLSHVLRGQGWRLRGDSNLCETKEYAKLEPYLIRLWRPCRRRREIIEECARKGYLIE